MADIYGKGPRGKATRLHAEIVRARGACERCGSTQSLQCAHIESRRFVATRTDLANAWCLCAGCHMTVDQSYRDKQELVERTIGRDVADELYQRARSFARWRDADWKAEVERLRAIAESVET